MATAGVTPRLAPGYISVYGRGSIYGFTNHSDYLTFGVIYEMTQNATGTYNVGQNVLFQYKNPCTGQQVDSVSYNGTQYWLITEQEIRLVEVEPTPPELS